MVYKILPGNILRELSPSKFAPSLPENSEILTRLQEFKPGGDTLAFLSFVANTDRYWADTSIREAALSLAEQSIIKVPVTNIALSFHPTIEAGLIANGGLNRIEQAFEQSGRVDKGAEKWFKERYKNQLDLHQPVKVIAT